ncbi:hypothetical protein FLA_2666 [Filimonas lacunae]|nr:hypothetical protein FLA_2666 [Filimonas lacunae]
MKLNENTATDAYTSGNHFNSEACSAGATMSTGEKPQYIYLNIYETKVNNEVQYADIEVNGLDYFGNCLSDTGYVYSNSHLAHTQYHESLQLNGREFTQVQEIIADTVRNGQTISHFWIAKNKGLVGFEENGNSTIFTLQP